MELTLKLLAPEFAVCRLDDLTGVALDREFTFLARTDEELSLVCPADAVPARTRRCDAGWRAFRIQGELDFALIGILARISGALAEAGVGLFAVSTYNTDYILVRGENLGRAVAALEAAGWRFED